MVSSQFGAILKEFESYFKCPLEPDANDSCLINLGLGISIQIELDRYGQILVGCRVGALPMSRYRDNLIKQALKENEKTLPSAGIFGFSQKSSQLILFLKLNPENLSVNKIQAIMPSFIQRAKQWADAISKSEIPAGRVAISSATPTGLFGLINK